MKIAGVALSLLISSSSLTQSQNLPAVDACWSAFSSQKIKTFTGWIQCLNQADGPTLRAQTSHQDLVSYLMTQRLVIAEQADRGKISLKDGVAQVQALAIGVTNEAQRRDAQANQQARSQGSQTKGVTFCNTLGISTICY